MKITNILFILFIFLFFLPQHSFASPGFTVSPPSMDFGVVQKGESKTLPINIYSTENISLKIKASNIKWLNFPSEIKLSAKESRTVNVTISIPTNAEPGEYRGSLNFIPIVEKKPGEITFVLGKGVDVHVKVPGKVVSSVEVNFPNITIPEGTENAIFKVYVKNTGTVTTLTTVRVKVNGKEEMANVKVPIKPNTIQEFRIEYQTKDLPAGNYTCMATVYYDGKTVTKEAKLIVKPKPVIPQKPPITVYVIIIAAVIAIITIFLLKKRRG